MDVCCGALSCITSLPMFHRYAVIYGCGSSWIALLFLGHRLVLRPVSSTSSDGFVDHPLHDLTSLDSIKLK